MPNTSTNTKRMTKGDGSLYFNEQKQRWLAQVDLGFNEDGKRIRKSVSARTKSEALSKVRDIFTGATQTKPKAAHTVVKRHDLYRFTLDYLNVFKKHSVKSRTFEGYCNISRYINRCFGSKSVEKLTALDIQRVLNTLAETKSDKTIKHIKLLLNMVLKHAVKQKIIPSNPMDDGVKRPKSQKPTAKREALPRELCQQILAAVDKSPTYKPIVTLLLYTGLRIGELIALRWQDVDREHMAIHVENAVTTRCEFNDMGEVVTRKNVIDDTKTVASRRVITVTQDVLDVIDDWREMSTVVRLKAEKQGNGDLVFPNQNGGLRSYQGFKKQIQRFWQESGLDGQGITFHKFRHPYVKHTLKNILLIFCERRTDTHHSE
ncbi:site-specific integrase [Clostridia bacterium]|nr:site-specific integrase [Clostridia bacterium]GHV35966.1 site-specific integrase [Clostridia bacterium]